MTESRKMSPQSVDAVNDILSDEQQVAYKTHRGNKYGDIEFSPGLPNERLIEVLLNNSIVIRAHPDIVQKVLNDWISTKNDSNVDVSNVSTGISKGFIYMDEINLGAMSLEVYKDYMDDPKNKAGELLNKAQSLLESRVCMWPVSLSNEEHPRALYVPVKSLDISFRVKDLNKPGFLPFSASYDWVSNKKELREALSSDTAPDASALLKHAEDLKKQKQYARIISQYNREQEKQLKRLRELSRKVSSITDTPIGEIDPDPEKITPQIKKLEKIVKELARPDLEALQEELRATKDRLKSLEARNQAESSETKNGDTPKDRRGSKIGSIATASMILKKKAKEAKGNLRRKKKIAKAAAKAAQCEIGMMDASKDVLFGDKSEISKEEFISEMKKTPKCLYKLFVIGQDDDNLDNELNNIWDAADRNKDGKMTRDEFLRLSDVDYGINRERTLANRGNN